MNNQNGNILTVNNLKTYFQTEDGVVKAVDGITFELKKGDVRNRRRIGKRKICH